MSEVIKDDIVISVPLPGTDNIMLRVDCPATYPKGCKMVFVGEAPDKEEVDAKEGFVGAAGRCLQKAAQVAGIEWSTVARSNVAKRRPGADHNDFQKGFYETIEEPVYTPKGKLSKRTRKVVRKTEELLRWEDALRDELRAQRPNLVVACGNQALQSITGLVGITNYRGSIVGDRWEENLKVLAVEHPSYIIRGNLTDFWILAYDLKKAKREAEFAEIRREPWQSYIHEPLDHILGYIDWLKYNPDALWTLDVETRAGTLACFAIGTKGSEGYSALCIPLQTTSGPYWSPEEECQIWEALNETAKHNPNLCNQNIEYDLYYLLRYGVEPSGVYMDTMLAHSILYPEFPKGLDFLCSFYLEDVVYYKGEGRDWGAGDRDPDLWAYNCKDAAFTLRVVEQIDRQLKERGLYDFYHGSPLHA